MMNDVVLSIIECVIAVLAMIITRYLIPWIKAQIENSQYKWIAEVVSDAVKYAEQTVRESGKGSVKKEMVESYIINQLQIRNITITDDQLNALIESAVYGIKQGKVNE